MRISTESHEKLKQYYGKMLQGTKDLKSSACCCADSDLPPRIRSIMGQIDEEILTKFYGCGSPLPPALEGKTVLDLGCGTGRDAYVVSRLAGPDGFVIGVDMTDEQIAVAKRHLDSQMKRFGYGKPDVDFRQGYIEDLRETGIADDSIVDHHLFITGKPMLVCGNTAAMLQETRFSSHFRIIGDRSVHYGPFDCAPASIKAEGGEGSCYGGACC